MKCPHCASRLQAGSVFCHRCGKQLTMRPTSRSGERSDLAARDSVARRMGSKPAPGEEGDFPEHEIWRGSYAAKGMVHLWLAAALVTLVLPVAAVVLRVDATIGIAIALLVSGLWGVLSGLLLFRKLAVRYVLTSERLLHEWGILTRYTHRIELIDIDDVSLRQSILERLISVGTIAIHSSDRTDPLLVMPGIDPAPRVAALIDDARRAERMRRGLYVESI